MTQAVFALSTDGAVALRELDRTSDVHPVGWTGWALCNGRTGEILMFSSRPGQNPQAAVLDKQGNLMRVEIRRMIGHAFGMTEFCQVLCGALIVPGAGTLDDRIWSALADLMWVLTS